jgi:hypothetical protein
VGFSNVALPLATAETAVVQVTGENGDPVTVTIDGTTVVEISGTVSASITGPVTVSSISSTVTIGGAVTITSGTVSVSSGTVTVTGISSTVTIGGAVTITSGTVAVSAITSTVTIAGAVTITSGTVSISSGTVTVSGISSTVTIGGAVTITSGTVAVSAITSTVTIAGAVTITSGTVSVSSGTVTVTGISSTVTIGGAVTITSGTVTVGSVTSTVTIAGAVTISSGTVSVSSVSGSVTIGSGTINVQNVPSTNLLTAPTLKQQVATPVTVQNSTGGGFATLSVPINSTDRVAVILLKITSGSMTTNVEGVMSVVSAIGGTTGVSYIGSDSLQQPSTVIPPVTGGSWSPPSPMIIPVLGAADSTLNLTIQAVYPGGGVFICGFTVTVLTAPDPSLLGSIVAPMTVEPAPAKPSIAVNVCGTQKLTGVPASGVPITIPTGFSWALQYVSANFTAGGYCFITDGATGCNIGQLVQAAAGRAMFFLNGLLFTESITFTYTWTPSGSALFYAYDLVQTPVPA